MKVNVALKIYSTHLYNSFLVQVEKVSYMEVLGGRVSVMEEGRQQSEARVKEEVDASLSHKMAAIDQVGGGPVKHIFTILELFFSRCEQTWWIWRTSCRELRSSL